MREKWPLTFAYLSKFRDFLLSRANYWKFFSRVVESAHKLEDEAPDQHLRLKSSSSGSYQYDISEAPFYILFNIGPYSFAPFRVCWSRMANTIRAVVVSEIDTPIGRRLVVPTDTATIVPFDDMDEAHFFCSVVNSSPFGWFVHSFSAAGRGFGSAGILARVQVPRFDGRNKLHTRLSNLSQTCHSAAHAGDLTQVAALEAQIDEAVAKLWGVTDDELKAIQDALAESGKSRRAAREGED
jgi:hypothetical protein